MPGPGIWFLQHHAMLQPWDRMTGKLCGESGSESVDGIDRQGKDNQCNLPGT